MQDEVGEELDFSDDENYDEDYSDDDFNMSAATSMAGSPVRTTSSKAYATGAPETGEGEETHGTRAMPYAAGFDVATGDSKREEEEQHPVVSDVQI